MARTSNTFGVIFAMITSWLGAHPAASQTLSERQKQSIPTINAYFKCGEIWAAVYGVKLPNENVESIAVAAAQKCTPEHEAAIKAVQSAFNSSDSDKYISMVNEKFSALVITSVLDGRLKAD